MNNFFNLTNEQRKLVIEQTSAKTTDLEPQIVEKDLWVTTFLQLIFSLPFADILCFQKQPLPTFGHWNGREK